MTDLPSRLISALAERYRLERPLGEGGMATVYLADDLKHKRQVALKVLKPDLAAVVGGERFLSEIETTANLQHPHILPLFDSGEVDSFLFYVMPFVEGESLRERLQRDRQLPVDEAVRIASDMAEALDYAHRHGVVHRDIKPGNVLMHEGRPLIADFGIAIAVGAAGGARLTETGLSVGTPYYMSPEQATGDQAVGAASDQYSLACVLYEMLVGEPPFMGATAQAVLGKIISGGSVSATAQRSSIPANVDAAIRRGLEKIPADRFPSARDFATALADPSFRHGPGAGVATVAGPWNRVAVTATAAAVVFAGAFGWAVTRPDPPAHVTRLAVQQAEEQRLAASGAFDISGDGRVIAYHGPALEAGGVGLWVQRLDQLEGIFIRGSDFAGVPALSPDGTMLAFEADGPVGIRVESLVGAGGYSVAQESDSLITSYIRWGPQGEWIYFEPPQRAGGAPFRLFRVPAAGGPVEQVYAQPAFDGMGAFEHFFDILPSGDGAVVEFTGAQGSHIRAVDFNTGESTVLAAGQFPRYASGHVLFAAPDGATLMAVPFDAGRKEATGPPVTVAEELTLPEGGWSFFAASQEGSLIYTTGAAAVREYHVVSVTREGVATVVDPTWTFDPGENNRGLAVSPGGGRLALTIFEGGNYDIWVKELPAGAITRVSFGDGWDVRPRWTPDGRVVYLSMFGGNSGDMRVVAASPSGTGEPVVLMDSELPFFETLYSPDMRWLLGRTGGMTTAPGGRDVWVMEQDVDTVPRNLLVTPFDEKAIDLSPDGRWLLYESDETGRNEIYVRPFPDVDADKVTVSTGGGVMPRWSRDGREIFYVSTDQELVAASIETDPRFRVRERTPLFPLPDGTLFRSGEQYSLYDPAPDGQSFYLFRSAANQEVRRDLVYVQNWVKGLPER